MVAVMRRIRLAAIWLLLGHPALAGQADTPRPAPRPGARFIVDLTTVVAHGQTRRERLVQMVVARDGATSVSQYAAINISINGRDQPLWEKLAALVAASGQTNESFYMVPRRLVIPFALGRGTPIAISYACDWADIARFFPPGTLPTLQTRCTQTLVRGGVPQPAVPVALTLTYLGAGRAETPAGTFDVRIIRMESTQGPTRSVARIQFSERLGTSVISETEVFRLPPSGAGGDGDMFETIRREVVGVE